MSWSELPRRSLRRFLKGGDGLRGVGLEFAQIHFLEQSVGLEPIGPEGGIETSSGDKVTAGVSLIDDVAAEVAQRGLKHIEDEVGSEVDNCVRIDVG